MRRLEGIKSILTTVLVAVAALALLLMPNAALGRDRDGDLYDASVDCNDNNASIYPNAPELCDEIDNQCPGNEGYGTVDEGCGLADSDGDGLHDSTESTGFTLPSGLLLANGSAYLPPCGPNSSRELCVDPNSPDVFVIINRASPSNLALPPYNSTNDPLAILRKLTNSLGASVVPHELKETRSTDRSITDGQHAIRVTEDLDPGSGALGFAPTGGTPNTTSGEVQLYTERIKNEIDRLCNQISLCPKTGQCYLAYVDSCQSDTGTPIDMKASIPNLAPLYAEYTQNVLAHEVAHVTLLAPPDSVGVSLYHWNPNTGWVMEQSIGAKGASKSGLVTVTLYISKAYHVDDKSKYKLK